MQLVVEQVDDAASRQAYVSIRQHTSAYTQLVVEDVDDAASRASR